MHFEGCPGSKMMNFTEKKQPAQTDTQGTTGAIPSALRQWPIQLHLISPLAPYYQGADVLLTADCVAYALGNYHSGYLQDKALAIACPKLDSRQEVYEEKIRAWMDEARINTLTVMIMQVPCCSGLLYTAINALQKAKRKVPLKSIVVGLQGDILKEEWVEA